MFTVNVFVQKVQRRICNTDDEGVLVVQIRYDFRSPWLRKVSFIYLPTALLHQFYRKKKEGKIDIPNS